MEHIHGKLLAEDGEKVLLDEVDGYLGSHPRRDGSPMYFRLLQEIPTGKTKGLDVNSPYRLVLDDGRIGDIYADVHPNHLSGTIVAEFHVTGNLKRSTASIGPSSIVDRIRVWRWPRRRGHVGSGSPGLADDSPHSTNSVATPPRTTDLQA